MNSCRLVLCLIMLTLLVTCLAAAAKLRTTPKYERIQVGMTMAEVDDIIHLERGRYRGISLHTMKDGTQEGACTCDEGVIIVCFNLKNRT